MLLQYNPRLAIELTEDDIARFWSKVDRLDDENACHLWNGCRSAHGYGRFLHKGKYLRAHRLALLLTKGMDPNLIAAHSCDNPPCANPNHLFPKTQIENIAERNEKGRQDHGPNAPCWSPPPPRGKVVGARCAKARLTEDQVRAIRELRLSGVPQVELARSFHVHPNSIGNILNGSTWKHVEFHQNPNGFLTILVEDE
jgi:hypothetical protein